MIYKRYLSPTVKYLLIYLFLPLIYILFFRASFSAYNFLADNFPLVFPEFNQVTDKEAYLAHEARCRCFAVLFSVFLSSYCAALYDNLRYERVITRTDGFFRIPRELPRYIRETVISDAVASAAVPLPFLLLTLIKYPERMIRFEKFATSLLESHYAIKESFGIFAGWLLIFAVAMAARLLAAPMALRRFRAMWLTSFVED